MMARRTMMTAATLGAAGLAAGRGNAAARTIDAELIHHVFFWLKDKGSMADRDRLIAGLRTLAAIPVIRALHVGVPAATEQRDGVDSSWDVSELMFFDDPAGQKTYQDHALHKAFVANCGDLWSKVVVYDATRA